MLVREKMTRDVHTCRPDTTLRDAACSMAERDIGAIPVSDGDRLVGMVTDRDIAIRGVAQGRGPDTPVREVMTDAVRYCFEDEDIGHVARNMGDIQVRRLPVVNRDKRLVGIVAIADIAVGKPPRMAGQAVAGVSRPGGAHSQASDAPAR